MGGSMKSIAIDVHSWQGRGDAGNHYFGNLVDENGPGCLAYSEADLRKQLKTTAIEAIRGYQAVDKNRRQAMIVCNSGDILLVQFAYGSYGYSILGQGRKHASVVMGCKDFDGTLTDARNHANGSYDGVAWEQTF
jgi:hypothetical protein